MVEIYNDAVEIISPGWFIEGQDPEEHLSGKSVSFESRNGLIALTLFKSGDIESQGTGIKRIKDYCDEANMKVEYVHTYDGTKLVFHRNDAFGRNIVIDTPTDSVGVNVGVNVRVNDKMTVQMSLPSDLSRRSLEVLNAIAANPSATAAQIAEECGITERSVQRVIRTLRENDIIYREGSDKTGKWVIRNYGE